jgi:hypothetical protein
LFGEAMNMVAKKTRVLLAMLSMDDFTTDELSRFSGVIPATVRVVMGRHLHVLETVSKEPTNRRGGQRIRYRLTSAGRDELSRTANATRQAFASAPSTFLDSLKTYLPLQESEIPLGLRLADDTLNRLVPQAASNSEKLDLLEAARREVQSALRANPQADRSISLRIDKAGKEKLEQIENARLELVRIKTSPAREPLLVPGVALGIGIQVWSGVALKSTLTKLVKNELQQSAEVIVSEVPTDPVQTPEVIDAVILLVDSDDSKKAFSQFNHALVLSSKVDKPMAVFDRGYNLNFRNHVYAAGITHFCNDAATLNGKGMRGLISGMLPPQVSNALMVDAPKLSQVPLTAGAVFLKQVE